MRQKISRFVPLVAWIAVLGLIVPAIAPIAAQESAARPACADAETSHQFDFWIGTWDVTANGEPAGVNEIRPILDGCVLQETWRGASGSAGSSFNYFNPRTGKWHQYWVWRQGFPLILEGGYADGKMVLEGESTRQDGGSVHNRITWYDNDDGTVRQHWQVSSDDGATWETAFDGLYRRRD